MLMVRPVCCLWEERGRRGWGGGTAPCLCVYVHQQRSLHPWAPVGRRGESREPRGWGHPAWPLLTELNERGRVIHHRVPHSAEPQAGLRPPQSRPLRAAPREARSSQSPQDIVCAGTCETPTPGWRSCQAALPSGAPRLSLLPLLPRKFIFKKRQGHLNGTHKVPLRCPRKDK